MSTTRTPATCTRSQINLLKMNRGDAARLPDADEAVTHATLRERIGHATLSKFNAAGVVTKARSLADDPEYESDGHLWTVPAGVAAWIEQNVDSTMTPCGCSTGIRTVTAGETYTCRNDECNETFDRETALEVVNG
jgi:hypothetical protein